MESTYLLSLDFKSHKIRAFFLEKHKEFTSLIPKYFKVIVKVQTEKLNRDGYSVDFCIVKNAIRRVSEQVEGKVIINNFLHRVRISESEGLVQVSSEFNEDFVISSEFIKVLNGSDIEKEFANYLILLTLTEIKTFNDIEDISAIQISVINLIDGKQVTCLYESLTSSTN